jgi:hypothetical protein
MALSGFGGKPWTEPFNLRGTNVFRQAASSGW